MPNPKATAFSAFLMSSLTMVFHFPSCRKAAKREILLCDFEGCGKIFSNRQYLNVRVGGSCWA